MKSTFKIIIALFVVFAGIFSSHTAKATDGYFSCGYGTQSKGMGGVGIAWYQNSLINGNPAGLVSLGKQYSVSLGLFNPNREYTVTGNPSMMPGTFGLLPGTVKSDSEVFVIPSIGANWMLNDKSSLSIALFGNGGMNTDFPPTTLPDGSKMGTFGSNGATGVNLMQMFLGVSYSRKIAENHSFGVTGLIAYQMFEAKGLGAFAPFSSAPDKLTDNGMDNATGFGFKLGYMGKLTKDFTIGASYQTMLYMSEFDDYAGLFAEQGDFNIPSTWTIGLAYEINEKWAVMADFKRINYTDVASVSNPLDAMALPPAFLNPGGNPTNPMDYTPNANHVPLGSDKGAGFGWEDINILKFGMEYSGIEDWTLRAGYSHTEQPIQKSEVLFNILAPGVIEDHVTCGFSKNIGDSGKAIHFALCYSLPASVKGPNPMDYEFDANTGMPVGHNQTIELNMNQLELDIAFTF